MTPSIIPIVSGIIDALLGSPEPEEREPENLSATAHIVVRKIGLMPRYMGLGLTVLTVAFDWTAVLTGGKRFRSLDRPRRQAWVNRWRRAPLMMRSSSSTSPTEPISSVNWMTCSP